MEKQEKQCCEMMKYHSTFQCKTCKDKYECPDTIIDFNKEQNSYQIIIHDGGTSGIEIKYCPWCNTNLTEN